MKANPLSLLDIRLVLRDNEQKELKKGEDYGKRDASMKILD